MGAGAALAIAGLYAASASVDSRIGWASTLPEFSGVTLPEASDAVSVSLSLSGVPGAVSGQLVDGRGYVCNVSGTYNVATGALSLTGAPRGVTIAISGTYSAGTITATITATRGTVSERLACSLAAGAAVSLGTAVYVDSDGGSDSNSGASHELAVATVERASELCPASGTIRVHRGETYRGMIGGYGTIGNPVTGLTVEAYGVGPRPIVCGGDVATNSNFALASGRTYTYEISWTPEIDLSVSGQFVVLEDGVALQFVDDATGANVEATAGTYYAPAMNSSGTYTILVHPRGNTNPTSDGKVYEISSRPWAVHATTVRGIHGRQNCHNDGVVIGNTVDNCVGEWGHKHNVFAAVSANRSAAIYSMCVRSNATLFVSYADNGTGISPSYTDCVAFGHPSLWSAQVVQPYYAHTDGASGHDFTAVSFTRCVSAYHDSTWSAVNTIALSHTDCLIYRAKGGYSGASRAADPGNWTVTRSRAYLDHLNFGGQYGLVATSNPFAETVLEQSIFSVRTGACVYFAGHLHMQHCVLRVRNRTETCKGLFSVNGAAVEMEHNTFLDVDQLGVFASTTTVASNSNIIWPTTTSCSLNGTNYSNITNWKATGRDGDSVTTQPTWVAESNPELPIFDEDSTSPTYSSEWGVTSAMNALTIPSAWTAALLPALAYTPDQTDQVALWVDPSRTGGITQAVVGDGLSISSLVSIIRSGSVATGNFTAYNGPLRQDNTTPNGKTSIRFNGSNQNAQTNSMAGFASPYHLFILCRFQDSTTGTIFDGYTAVNALLRRTSSTRVEFYTGSANQLIWDTTDANLQQWHVYEIFNDNSANAFLAIDGTVVDTGNPGSSASPSGFTLANRPGSTFGKVDLGPFVAARKQLNATEVARIRAYMAAA